jgi:hypothetical protein
MQNELRNCGGYYARLQTEGGYLKKTWVVEKAKADAEFNPGFCAPSYLDTKS